MAILGKLPGHYDLLEASTLGFLTIVFVVVLILLFFMINMGMNALHHKWPHFPGGIEGL
jgi:Na+-transporting methylmalonyl-CoA/oxaloacetate decarboxylase gamma subunit